MSETPGQNPLGESPAEPPPPATTKITRKRPQTLNLEGGTTPAAVGTDLERRVAALEAKPKRVPPKPRRALPAPRAAVQIAWIISITMLLIFGIMLVGVIYVADTLPLLGW